MKIFIVPSWYPTKINPAVGTFFVDRAQFIQNAGHDVVIIVSIAHSLRKLLRFNFSSTRYNKCNMEYGLKTYRNEYINWRPFVPQLFFNHYKKILCMQTKNILKEFGKPDLVLINSSLWAGAALSEILHMEDIPYIVSEHLKEFLIPNGFSHYQLNCINISYQYAKNIIATSSSLQKAIVNYFPNYSNKIKLIPNPTDYYKYSSLNKQKITDVPFKFISVAAFRSEKRIDLLLHAFNHVIQEYDNINLTIIGDGPEKKSVLSLIRKMNLQNKVTLKGHLYKNEIVSELCNSNAFVLSSDVETFGVVLIEALACGIPIVATRCGGPEDIVSSETGILIDKGSSKELALGMKQMLIKYKYFQFNKLRSFAKEQYGERTYLHSLNSIFNSIAY